jgi:hypothetical protein
MAQPVPLPDTIAEMHPRRPSRKGKEDSGMRITRRTWRSHSSAAKNAILCPCAKLGCPKQPSRQGAAPSTNTPSIQQHMLRQSQTMYIRSGYSAFPVMQRCITKEGRERQRLGGGVRGLSHTVHSVSDNALEFLSAQPDCHKFVLLHRARSVTGPLRRTLSSGRKSQNQAMRKLTRWLRTETANLQNLRYIKATRVR